MEYDIRRVEMVPHCCRSSLDAISYVFAARRRRAVAAGAVVVVAKGVPGAKGICRSSRAAAGPMSRKRSQVAGAAQRAPSQIPSLSLGSCLPRKKQVHLSANLTNLISSPRKPRRRSLLFSWCL